MALIVGDLLQSLVRECGDNPPDPVISLDWLQLRYETVLSRAPFSFLIKEATFQTVAAITAGTVTVTSASATVSETTDGTNGWSSSIEGRYFRATGDSEFFPIDTYTSASPDTLTLNRVFEEATATEKGYKIFQRFYSLASDAREVISMARINAPDSMDEVSQRDLNNAFPHRPTLGNPSVWAMAGTDSSDNLQVELYQIPDEAQGILYQYLIKTPSLVDADVNIIPQVPFGLLKSGWMSDYWAWRGNFDNAPPNAGTWSQKHEADFERRLFDLVRRESANIPPVKLRLSDRLVRHRVQRVNKFQGNVFLESSE